MLLMNIDIFIKSVFFQLKTLTDEKKNKATILYYLTK